MRIGIDCRALQEPQPSGVSVYTLHLLRSLLKRNASGEHSFLLFFNGWQFHSSTRRMQMQEMILRDIPQSAHATIEWRFSTLPSKLFTAATILFRHPRPQQLFPNADVIFLPNMDFIAIEQSSIPMVMTVHDFSHIRYSNLMTFKERVRSWLLRPSQMMQSAAAIVPVSLNTQHDLFQLEHVDAKKSYPLYPGIDHLNIGESVKSPSTDHVHEKSYILSIGTLEGRKNIESLLDAFATVRQRHPQLELKLIGRRTTRSDAWEDLIGEMKGVELCDYLPEEKKLELLAGAVVCLYPSVYEGFGFPPLEAQAHGVPVIVGNNSSLPEVVGESSLMVDVHDVRSLTRALESLLTDRAFAQQLVHNGFANIKRFSWDRAAERLLYALDKAARSGTIES